MTAAGGGVSSTGGTVAAKLWTWWRAGAYGFGERPSVDRCERVRAEAAGERWVDGRWKMAVGESASVER